MEKNKMDWLVKKYKENECEFILSKTDEPIGTCVMPTGAGKSGVSFEDAMWHIDHKSNDKKLIINFSAPILKLLRQSVGDFFNVLSETHTELIENGRIMFLINSSDGDEGYYAFENGIDTFRFNEGIDKFYKSKRADIAIVASCHKSLDKFVAKMPTMRKYATTVTYLDESHLINDVKSAHGRNGKNYEENPHLIKLCENSDFLYALTATPDRGVTEKINEYNGHNGDCAFFIHKTDARELIEKNIILPPRVEVMHMPEDCVLSADLLISYRNKLKKIHPNINLKILVTCKNSAELIALEKALIKKGQKVYSTCSKAGCHKTNADGEFADEIDEVAFMDEVNNYNDGDCFVLHIRQLIQGIDIKSITSCVICTGSHYDSEVNKRNIQIIGRCLRPLDGERGMSIEDRKKKVGDVLFIMPENFEGENSIISFIEKYYGIGYIVSDYRKTPEPFHKPSKEETIEDPFDLGITFKHDEIEHNSSLLLFNIEEYIKKRLVPKHNWLIKNGGTGINIVAELNNIAENCGAFSGDYDSVVLLSRTNLQEAIKNLFEKYDIVETL